MNIIKKLSLAILGLSTILFSCKSTTEVVAPTANVPTTYNFSTFQANSTLASVALAMMTDLINETETGNTKSVSVSSTSLINKFRNTNTPFNNAGLNTVVGISLKELTSNDLQAQIETYLLGIETASLSNTDGANSVAGVVVSNAGSKKLYDAKGVALYELAEKGLMGALQYYQITSVYLSENKIGSSVSTAERQKNWDLAFGFLGVDISFPSTTTSKRPFWAEYLATNSAKLDNNTSKIMNAYLQGRAAIDLGDNVTISTSASIIKTELEKTAVSMALTYLNRANAAILSKDNGRKLGSLSESKGFFTILKYSPTKKITDTQYNEINELFGDNNWNTSSSTISNIVSKLSGIYGLDSTQF
jgi:hypothetical protein